MINDRFSRGTRVIVRHRDPRWDGLRGEVIGREHDDPVGMLVLRIDGEKDPHWFDDRNVELEETAENVGAP